MFFLKVFVKKSVRVSMALHSASSGINYVVCKMMGIKWRSGWSLGEKEVDEIIQISVQNDADVFSRATIKYYR